MAGSPVPFRNKVHGLMLFMRGLSTFFRISTGHPERLKATYDRSLVNDEAPVWEGAELSGKVWILLSEGTGGGFV